MLIDDSFNCGSFNCGNFNLKKRICFGIVFITKPIKKFWARPWLKSSLVRLDTKFNGPSFLRLGPFISLIVSGLGFAKFEPDLAYRHPSVREWRLVKNAKCYNLWAKRMKAWQNCKKLELMRRDGKYPAGYGYFLSICKFIIIYDRFVYIHIQF